MILGWRTRPSARVLVARRALAVACPVLAVVLGLALTDSAAAGSPQAPPRCTVAQLAITEAQASDGLGHGSLAIRFRDRGLPCRLGGYPGADALDSSGHVTLVARRRRSGYLGGLDARGPIPTVTLSRGRMASALVEWTLGPVRGLSCRPASRFELTPPGDRRAVTLKGLGDGEVICDFEVHPVVPGTDGSDPSR